MSDNVLKATSVRSDDPPWWTPARGKLRIAVGIATAGRRAIVGCTLDLIARQTRLPDVLIVCPAIPEDLDAGALQRLPFETAVRTGKRGLTAQRNQILAA